MYKVIALVALLGGCEVLTPAAVKPKPPQPGAYLSTPFPDVRSLNDVVYLSPTLAYAVGTGGTILKYTVTPSTKKGVFPTRVWSKETTGTTEDLESISGFLDSDGKTEHILVAGHGGTVLERSGKTWKSLTSGVTKDLFGVHLLSSGLDGFVVGDAGTILRYDGTTHTLAVQTTQTLQDVKGLPCGQAGCGTATCEGDGICHAFFPIPEPLTGVGPADGNTEVAVGARGAAYVVDPTAGAAALWTKETTNTNRNFASIFTRSGVMMPTTDGVLDLRSGANQYTDDPNNGAIVAPAPVFLQDVWIDGGDVYTLGFSQEIFHRNGSGVWDLTTVSLNAEMRGIDGIEAPPDDDATASNIQQYLAVGAGGRIVRGPAVLPANGEELLATRLATSDFVDAGP
jgi:hypothetical protein